MDLCEVVLEASFSCKASSSSFGSLRLSCGVVPQALCKGSGCRLEGYGLVESEPSLCGEGSPENRVRPLWRWLTFVVTTPLQRRRTSPQKEGTTGITSSSPCAPRSVTSILLLPYIFILLRIALCASCHIGKFTLVAYLENLPILVKPNLKKN